jgi:mRNA-degrading endonuclease RelE of RelBE toxin-antitoxin system
MGYVVKMPKNFDKIVREMPANVKKTLLKLVDDIREKGPVQSAYPNFSKLGKVTYHCHLARKWVACWRCKNGEYIVEVEYVGSREKAPY